MPPRPAKSAQRQAQDEQLAASTTSRQTTARSDARWEEVCDLNLLRRDLALQTAVGRVDELASAPTLSRLESSASSEHAAALHGVSIDQFIAAHRRPPKELVFRDRRVIDARASPGVVAVRRALALVEDFASPFSAIPQCSPGRSRSTDRCCRVVKPQCEPGSDRPATRQAADGVPLRARPAATLSQQR